MLITELPMIGNWTLIPLDWIDIDFTRHHHRHVSNKKGNDDADEDVG